MNFKIKYLFIDIDFNLKSNNNVHYYAHLIASLICIIRKFSTTYQSMNLIPEMKSITSKHDIG